LDTWIYTGLLSQVHILLRNFTFRRFLRAYGRGYGKYIALPLFREFYARKRDDVNSITKDEAIGVIRKCMEVLYYRVCSL
jgi:ABC-type transporter lipoprotein component MlaA